ncbi:recombinase family protein [Vibrio harveyi]|uniref:recombinase family protein n=1 Tax=Vibrio harveyi TaxID=669 RepID=UPI0023807B61|nr:recombinase family protein [Vibrio harveyi]
MSYTFGYARTSHHTQSIQSQTMALTDTDYTFERVYTDEGISGSIACLDRDGFSRLADAARSGDVVVIWWFDRIGRDYLDSKNTAQVLLQRGITIKTVNQNLTLAYKLDGSPEAIQHNMQVDILLSMLAGFAAAEKANRRASQDAGREALRVEGAVNKNGETWEEAFKGKRANSGKNAGLYERIAEELGLENPLSIRKIAAKLGCNPSTVQTVKKKLNG